MVEHAVEYALKNGYSHVDTAAAYSNEAEVCIVGFFTFLCVLMK